MNVHTANAPESGLSISVAAVASAFLGTGLLLILLETLFFREVAALAHSSYGPRAIIGFHLFFSEIWFIFVGNLLMALMLVKQDFKFDRAPIENSAPLAVIFAVYAIWYVYGSLAGNNWALEEFREMVFNMLCLPSVIFFAAHTSAARLFRRIILMALPVAVVASLFASHKSVLMVTTIVVGYFLLRVLYGFRTALFGLMLSMLPFFIRFEKPMIALLAFTLVAASVLAGHLNSNSKNWILSKFKLKIVTIAVALVAAALLLAFVVNSVTGGLIEDIVQFHFLKLRLNSAGELQQGDLSGGRIAIWKAALVDWKSNPLLGHGLGSAVKAFSAGWVTKVQYHNYLVQALHNTGLVGSFLIVGALIKWVRQTLGHIRQVEDPSAKLIFACLFMYVINLLFYGFYGHSLSFPPTTQLFWVCVGVLCVPLKEQHLR